MRERLRDPLILTAYRVLAPFVALLLPLVAIFNRKVRAGLALRRVRSVTPNLSARPIWIHVSSGEFEYAKPVIRELKRRRPDIPIVVTFFSPSYARQVTEFPGVDHAEPSPLDLPGPVGAFLDRIAPRLCLVSRTDFWPELLAQTARRNIPRVVFAYTQAPVSGLKSRFTKWQLGMVDEVRAVSAADLEHTLAIGPDTKARADGDPRYDQVAHRLADPRELPAVFAPARPALVAGSTWDEDEAVLLPGVAELLKTKRLQLILVPHEPTPAHLNKTILRLEGLGLTHVRASARRDWSKSQVLLVDEVGYLAELYALGAFAFIGGSFKAKVHSVMEALGAGLVTLTGPLIQNNREAQEFVRTTLAHGPGLTVIEDAKTLATSLEAWLGRDYEAQGHAVRDEFTRRTGASARLVDSILDQKIDQ